MTFDTNYIFCTVSQETVCGTVMINTQDVNKLLCSLFTACTVLTTLHSPVSLYYLTT